MKNILINSSNLVSNGYGDTYTYTFPTPVTFKNDRISLSRLSLYYSWRNISSSYGNNTWSYRWIDGTVVNITIPDGFYTVENLNALLQSFMVANKHYLTNTSTGTNLYYLEVITSSVYYSVQLNCYAVPTSLPSGYSVPAGATWSFPGTATTPQLTIPTGLSSILGITAGTYPSVVQSTTFSQTSQTTPQVSPVNSVIITCTLVSNDISTPNTVLYSFSPDVSYGSIIQVAPPTNLWCNISDGIYSSLTIQMRDQNFGRINFLDTSGMMLLSVKNNSES